MTTGRRLRRFLRWTGQLFCWIVAGVRPAGVVTTTTTATYFYVSSSCVDVPYGDDDDLLAGAPAAANQPRTGRKSPESTRLNEVVANFLNEIPHESWSAVVSPGS
uniref:(northern house mosquito) hypothetical protein n=1 Tax=Culex pipiens TaxID=7175 RepID=A0A8D8I4B3_CULPI